MAVAVSKNLQIEHSDADAFNCDHIPKHVKEWIQTT